MPISLNPETFSSGGLLNDADVEIVSSRFTVYDYNGVITQPEQMSVSLRLDLKVIDTGEEHTEYFSFGRNPDWVISDDGCSVDPVAGKRPNNNSVFSFFIQSLLEAGFDKALLDKGDISVLEGLKAHVVRKAAPESWKSLPGMKRDDKQREKTYLAIERILSKPAGAAPSKTGSKNAADSKTWPQDLMDDVLSVMADVLPADGKAMKIKIAQVSVLRKKDISQDKKKAVNDAIQGGILQAIPSLRVNGDEVSLVLE